MSLVLSLDSLAAPRRCRRHARCQSRLDPAGPWGVSAGAYLLQSRTRLLFLYRAALLRSSPLLLTTLLFSPLLAPHYSARGARARALVNKHKWHRRGNEMDPMSVLRSLRHFSAHDSTVTWPNTIAATRPGSCARARARVYACTCVSLYTRTRAPVIHTRSLPSISRRYDTPS